ncbi:MAG: signal peptidase II [Candidatus Doudnabacteria bacterium]|nr:signal peptidase II [Candidatus Doudnabacteria bacterium]
MRIPEWQKVTTATAAVVFLFWLASGIQSLVLKQFSLSESFSLTPHIFLQPEQNFNFAFGFSLPPLATLLIGLAAFLTVAIFFLRSLKKASRLLIFAFSFILSGAVFNLYSRASNGFAWDYLGVRLLGLEGRWNLADIFILAGLIVWLYDLSVAAKRPGAPSA